MPAAERRSYQWVYLHVEAGKFWNKGRDGNKTAYEGWEGEILSVSLYMDAAPGYEKRLRVRLVLADGNERTAITASAETAFGRMLAGYLVHCQQGDRVAISVSSGDNAKVSFCHFETLDREDGEWRKGVYTSYQGETSNAAAVQAIRALPYYEPYEPRETDTEGLEEKERARAMRAFSLAVETAKWPIYSLNSDRYLEWAETAFKKKFGGPEHLTADHFDMLRTIVEAPSKWPTPDWRPSPLVGITDDFDPFAD